jgi:hypothetical protein
MIEVEKVEDSNEILYYIKGKGPMIPHREDGPAVFHKNTDYKAWYINGRRHREDGPAIKWNNGSEEWYINGRLHRVEGPAVIRNEDYEWWLDGNRYTKEEWFEALTEEQKKKALYSEYFIKG